MDRWQSYPVQFQGGLITNLSPLAQATQFPGSAALLRNFEPSTDGGYRRIQGFSKVETTQVGGSSGRIRGVVRFNGRTYAVKGTSMYYSTGSGWSSAITTGLGGTGKVRFARHDFGANPELIIIDGVNKPFKLQHNGTPTSISTAGTEQTAATAVVDHKNHLFFAKGKTLSFSAPFDAEDYTAASGAGVIEFDNTITNLASFREQLIVFTTSTIFLIAGSSIADFQVQPVTRDIGAIKEDTVQEVGGDLMFLGPDGLRLLSATERNNDFGLGVVSKVIQSEVTNFTNVVDGFESVVIRGKSQYRLLGFSSTNNASGRGIIGTQFAMQGGEGMAWAETRGINAFCADSTLDGGVEYIHFGNDDGYVYRMEQGNNFAGDNIFASFKTPTFPITDPTTRKTFYKMKLFTDPAGSLEVTMSPEYDFDEAGTIQPQSITVANTTSGTVAIYGSGEYGSASYGGANLKFVFDLDLVGSAFVGSYTFTSDNTDPPFSFDSMIIQYGQYGRR